MPQRDLRPGSTPSTPRPIDPTNPTDPTDPTDPPTHRPTDPPTHRPIDPPQGREGAAGKLCFTFGDMDSLRARIVQAGGQVRDPWSRERTRFTECTDPESDEVQIVEVTA